MTISEFFVDLYVVPDLCLGSEHEILTKHAKMSIGYLAFELTLYPSMYVRHSNVQSSSLAVEVTYQSMKSPWKALKPKFAS